jgi:putative endonuclease
LENKEYEIVERNFKAKQGEIDIIAIDKCELVFIEVKTRTSIQYGKPVEAVNNIKQKHLIKTIEYYLYIKKLENKFIRIDVIEIYLYNNRYKVNHIKQII